MSDHAANLADVVDALGTTTFCSHDCIVDRAAHMLSQKGSALKCPAQSLAKYASDHGYSPEDLNTLKKEAGPNAGET